jgi:FixJ family two-component response regulator
MPGLTGFQVQVRLAAAHANLPVILITAFDDDETRSRAFELGAMAFFHKPLECGSLRRRWRSHRQGCGSRAEAGLAGGLSGMNSRPTHRRSSSWTTMRPAQGASTPARRAGWNAEACASARIHRPHDPAQRGCPVLDVSMPEIDGPEL